MAVKIRLARQGKKKNPHYRIVACDSRFARDGRFLEKLGTYDPMKKPAVVEINEDRIKYWLSVGAQTSDTVKSILDKNLSK